MQKGKFQRIEIFDRRLRIPVSIVCAIAFLYWMQGEINFLTVAFSALAGGWLMGTVASWLIANAWNIGGVLLYRKSGSVGDALQCGIGDHHWSAWAYLKKGECIQKRHCPVCGEVEKQVEHDRATAQYTYANTLVGMPEHFGAFENILSEHFSQSDLNTFCFQNKLDYENLEGDSKIENIRSLINLHNQNRNISTLVSALRTYQYVLSDDLDKIFAPPVKLSESPLSVERVCEQYAYCLRCGDVETDTVHQHTDWHRERELQCDYTRTCLRCDEQEKKVEHRWGIQQYIQEGICKQVKICHQCGAQEKITGEQHIYQDRTETSAQGRIIRFKICTRCGHRK